MLTHFSASATQADTALHRPMRTRVVTAFNASASPRIYLYRSAALRPAPRASSTLLKSSASVNVAPPRRFTCHGIHHASRGGRQATQRAGEEGELRHGQVVQEGRQENVRASTTCSD